jgi:hypothetical protein
MRPMAWMGIVIVLALTIDSAAMYAQDAGLRQAPGLRCSQATIRGTWGIQIQGTRPVGTDQVETIIGVVLRTYDGHGNFTQIDNVHGSLSGIVRDRPGFGTYEVNADCSLVAFLLLPGPPFSIEERGVIVDSGNEIRAIVAEPLPVMVSSVHRRVQSR